MAVNLAEATRGDEVETIHLGHVAVVDAAGALVAWAGDPGARAYFRSSAKVFQSIPLVAMGAADTCGLSTAELAIATSSHSGSAHHRAIVSGLLNRLGVSEQDLRCGYSPPVDESERARITLGLAEHSQVACECSGEHAGMLGTCRHAGWGIEHYERPEHPLQRLILAIVVAA